MSVGIGLFKSLYADGAASFASLYNMGITAELCGWNNNLDQSKEFTDRQ